MALGIAKQEPLSSVYASNAIPIVQSRDVTFSKIEGPLVLIVFDEHVSLKV